MAETIVYTLPFPMPTWNRLLSMTLRERMICKKTIRDMTFMSIQFDENSQTSTESQSKQHSMLLSATQEAYLKMIRPASSDRYPYRKKSASKKPRPSHLHPVNNRV